jgi:hypothetical protein
VNLINFKQFWAKYGKYIKGLTPWGLVVVAVIFAYLKPAQVRTEYVEKKVEIATKDVRIDELIKQFESLNRDYQEMKNSTTNERYHKERTETYSVDGSKVIKEVEDRNIDSVVNETKRETEVRVVEVTKEVIVKQTETVYKTEFVNKVTEPVIKNWHLSIMGGVHPQLTPTPNINSWVFGGSVERRVFALPAFIGLWGQGTTAGAAAGGLSIGIEL